MFSSHTATRCHHLAREVEAGGFDPLWFPEHSHVPVSRVTRRAVKRTLPAPRAVLARLRPSGCRAYRVHPPAVGPDVVVAKLDESATAIDAA